MLEGEGSEEENFLARSDLCSERLGLYKRKKESKKTRRHALVQEKRTCSRQRNSLKKTRSRQKSVQENDQEKKLFLFLWFLERFLFSCTSFFLGRVRVIILFSYFLFFFYKFPAQVTRPSCQPSIRPSIPSTNLLLSMIIDEVHPSIKMKPYCRLPVFCFCL